MTGHASIPSQPTDEVDLLLGQEVRRYFTEKAQDYIREQHNDIAEEVYSSAPDDILSRIQKAIHPSGELQGSNDPEYVIKGAEDDAWTTTEGQVTFESGDMIIRYDLHLTVEEVFSWQGDNGDTAMSSTATYAIPFEITISIREIPSRDVEHEVVVMAPNGVEDLDVHTYEV